MRVENDGELRGEVWDVDNQAYHADRGADSSSSLKVARRSLELYESVYITGDSKPTEPSAEMIFGSAFHCALLEPEEFAGRYVYEPEEIDGEPINRRLKKHREYLEGLQQDNDRTVLPAAAAVRIMGMMNMVDENPAARKLMESGLPEVAVRFTLGHDQVAGFPLKAMFDFVSAEDGVIVDVKTTRLSGNSDVFSREIANREYHCQAALYCEAFRQLYGELPDFYWLFVHSDEPYETYIFKMGEATREIGMEIQLETIGKLQAARALEYFRNTTHQFPSEVIEVPDWTLRKFGKEAS